MTTGLDEIFNERLRQIKEKGWTAEHDDTHADGSLAEAAEMLLEPGDLDPDIWDVSGSWAYEFAVHARQKYSGDLIHRLAIAGALIAAEIDRIKRAAAVV